MRLLLLTISTTGSICWKNLYVWEKAINMNNDLKLSFQNLSRMAHYLRSMWLQNFRSDVFFCLDWTLLLFFLMMFSLRRRVRCSGGFLPRGGCCLAAVSHLFSSEARLKHHTCICIWICLMQLCRCDRFKHEPEKSLMVERSNCTKR